jgi:hypothetical protein
VKPNRVVEFGNQLRSRPVAETGTGKAILVSHRIERVAGSVDTVLHVSLEVVPRWPSGRSSKASIISFSYLSDFLFD